MAITFEEVAKTVLDLVGEVQRLNNENKALKDALVKLDKEKSVREPDNPNINPKPIPLKEVK